MQNSSLDADLKSASKFTLVWAILAIGTGVVAIIVPAVATVTTAIFIGWILIFAGAVTFIDAFAAPSAARIALRVVLAVLTIAVGIYLLVEPLKGSYTLTVMLVIWFVAVGFIRLAAGLANLGRPGAGMYIFNGAVSLLLGILIGNNLPSSADWAIGLLVGIELIFSGITAIVIHSAIKDAQDDSGGPGTAAFA